MKKGFTRSLIVGALAQSIMLGSAHAGAMGSAYSNSQYRWSGFYIGGNIGGKWGQFSAPLTIDTLSYGGTIYGPSVFSFDQTQASLTGGAQIGFDYQMKNLVLGVEANFNGEQLQGYHEFVTSDIIIGGQFLAGDTLTTTNNWQSSVLARLGLTTGDWLFYLTGGVAFADAKFAVNFVSGTSNGFTLPVLGMSQTKVLTGGTFGLGTEYALSDNWRIGVEGRYTDYGKAQYNLSDVALVALSTTTFVTSPVSANLHMETAEMLFKVKYLFNC